MGTNNLIERNGRITAEWFNDYRSALSEDLCPRAAGGTVIDRAANIGTQSLQWLRAYIASGDWAAGDIMTFFSYNGEATISHGWMLCDGRIISETNYNTEHGAGAWAYYIGSSPLDGLYLPNMVNKLPVGVSATTQDGSSTITSVGNTSHQIDISHLHHWLRSQDGDTHDKSYNASGSLTDIGFTSKSQIGFYKGPAALKSNNYYTDKQLSTTQSILPAAVETLYYMRIV